MAKCNFLLFIGLFTVIFVILCSFSFADKLVLITNSQVSPNISNSSNVLMEKGLTNTSTSLHRERDLNTNPTRFVPKTNPELLDFSTSQLKIVSDSEYNNLKGEGNIILIGENIDLSKKQLFQNESMPLIYADVAWGRDVNGSGVIVGVVDSGSDNTISQLNERINVGRNFYCYNGICDHGNDVDYYTCDFWHGCAVSSIIGANGSDFYGVAPDVNFAIARIFNGDRYMLEGDYNVFFYWLAQQGVRIVNNSWGTPSYDLNSGCAYNDDPLWEDVWMYQVDYDTLANGLLLIESAGNSGNCADDNTLGFEAMGYNVLTVGSTNKSKMSSSFSSRGPTFDGRKKPDITAPGEDINSYGAYDEYAYPWNGTSASAPHVTGAAALLQQIGLSNLEIKTLLINSADDISTEGWDKYTGWGFLNIQNALDWNSYLAETYVDDSILTEDTNTQLTYLYPTYANFYDINDTNIKCTISWNRYFDIFGEGYVQNFDLFLKGEDSNTISDSEIDNVEQTVLNNANFSHLKVYCADEDCSPDINYALSCNIDINQITLDYLIDANETDFYSSSQDGNFTINFNVGKLTEETRDINFDLNVVFTLTLGIETIYSGTEEYADVNSNTILGLDLNCDYANLKDYNLELDYNIYSSDYDNTSSGLGYVYLDSNEFDNNSPQLSTAMSGTYYASDGNVQGTLLFSDNSIFSVRATLYKDGNIVSDDYNYQLSDLNTITYYLDFNSELEKYKEYTYVISGKDVFGNTTDTNIVIYYSPIFDETNYYLDFDNNLLYYKEGLTDLNLIFNSDSSKDYNIYFNDTNESVFNNESGLFFYNFDPSEVSSIIVKDNNLDNNVLEFTLTEDLAPSNISLEKTGYSFTISYLDDDINEDAVSLFLGGSSLAYALDMDENTLTGTLSSSCGSHTLLLYLVDLSDNNSEFSYTYTITCSSGGSSGGGSSSNQEEVEEMVVPEPIKAPKDYSVVDADSITDVGDYNLETTGYFFTINIADANGIPVENCFAKIFYDNTEKIVPITNGTLKLSNSWQGKSIVVMAYLGNEIIFKKEITLPLASAPKEIPKDLNTSKIVPFEDKNTGQVGITDSNLEIQKEVAGKSYILYVVISLLVICVFGYLVYVVNKGKIR